VDGVDDLGVVDALEVDRGDADVAARRTVGGVVSGLLGMDDEAQSAAPLGWHGERRAVATFHPCALSRAPIGGQASSIRR
jgi:hypothetical protein